MLCMYYHFLIHCSCCIHFYIKKMSVGSNFLFLFIFLKNLHCVLNVHKHVHITMMMIKIELTMDNQKEAFAQQQVPLPPFAVAHPTPDFQFSSTTQMCLRILLIDLLRVCEHLLHLDRIVGLEQSHPINLQ